MSVWDDPEMKVGGDFVTFNEVGDRVSGHITVVRKHRFDDNSVVPQLLLVTDDGEEKTVTAGQVRLKAKLSEERPEAGDHISIELTQKEKRQGGKELKHFDVVVTRGGVTQPAATPAAAPVPATPPAPPQPDPQTLAAAIANMSPEQKQQLGLA